MPKECSICTQQNSHYKCPKCSSLYCSSSCCKKHKEICENFSDIKNFGQVNHENFKQFEEIKCKKEDNNEIISEEIKDKMKNSIWLKDILKSKRLRDQITAIDNSGDRESALKVARKCNSEFDRFLIKLNDCIENL